MSFNHPWLFWLAMTLPAILTLYILRPRRKKKVLPSTLFWAAGTSPLEASRPWRRLQPNLLLLLQLLVAALLVFASVGPVWTSTFSARSIIVLLDTSASMGAALGDSTRLEKAREKVVSLAAGLRQDAVITVVAFDKRPRVVVRDNNDPREVRRALEKISPSACAADARAALSLARALAGQYREPRLVLVSDGGLDFPAEDIEFIPVGRGDASVAIASLSLRPTGSGQAARVTVVNHGSQEARGTVSLWAGQHRQGAREWQLGPGEAEHFTWQDLPRNVSFKAELQPEKPAMDLLPLDNRAWAVSGQEHERKILLVSKDNLFLQKALALVPGARVYLASPEQYRELARGNYTYDITVLEGLAEPLAPGALLLVNPPAGRLAPGLEAGGKVGPAGLEAAPDSQLTEHVNLDGVIAGQARALKMGPGWSPDILAGDKAVFSHGEVDGRRVAVCSLDLGTTDLVLRPAFPVLIQNTVAWLFPAGLGLPGSLGPGEELVPVPPPLARRVTVERVGGETMELAPPFPPAPWEPVEPGLYRFIAYGGTGSLVTGEVAVNGYHPGEADLRVRDPRGEEELLPANRAAATSRAIPLARWLAFGALLAMMAEWGVASRGR